MLSSNPQPSSSTPKSMIGSSANTTGSRTEEDTNDTPPSPPPPADLRTVSDLFTRGGNKRNNGGEALNDVDSAASLSDWYGEDDGDDDDDDFDGNDDDVENLQVAAAKKARESLAREETQAVSCLRYVVLALLLAFAVTVTLLTFLYARSEEYQSFVAEFDGVAATTVRSFAEAFEHKLAAMDVLSASVTSHALEAGETFPNVTVPNWEVKAAQLRVQTDGIFAFYLPLVTDETRAGYEAYSQLHWQHIIQSYMAEEGMRQYQDKYFGIEKEEETEAAADEAAEEEEATAEGEAKVEEAEQQQQQQQQQQHYHHDHGDPDDEGDGNRVRTRSLHAAPPEIHPTIHEGIWGLTLTNGSWIDVEGTGPYLPLWHLSPIIPYPGIVNYNFLAYYDLAPMMLQTLESGKAGLSYLQTNHTGSNTADLIRIFMTLNQYRHLDIDYQEDPLTQVTYPVFDNFSPWKREVSGMIITTIFWRLLFANILPESVKGVVCVLSNTLGESVTYQINGREVIFLGTGDLHDNKYDDMGVFQDIAQYLKERAGPQTQAYTTVELDTGYTSYQIDVYPSQTMEDTYITTDPILYAVVVAFVFIVTGAVFMLYDYLVERRQAKVMDKAVKSTAVVTSLFPEAVHERLFADAEKSADMSKDLTTSWRASTNTNAFKLPEGEEPTTIAEIMRRSAGPRNAPPDLSRLNGRKSTKKIKGKPIADKFPNVTIFFADLAGFTKWSSTREPEHVFILLETIYGAFDKVACRREVFKVETIGDCYMAATGLPSPQADHAVRMVKFARDCMTRMQRLVEELSQTLGMDTLALAMRVGLHSGPVTAGVLRGDKGRFQLFGDTVNTASRMESNGVKGTIHVSESTAALLPSRWLTVRKDKIVAKGKGEMTTYFVDAGQGARSSLASCSPYDSLESSLNGCEGEENIDVYDFQTPDNMNMTYNERIAHELRLRDLDAPNFSASTPQINDGNEALRQPSNDSQIYHDYGGHSSLEEDQPGPSIACEDEARQRESHNPTPWSGGKTTFGKLLGVSSEVEV